MNISESMPHPLADADYVKADVSVELLFEELLELAHELQRAQDSTLP